jgi:ectoine hydroxylase-related dioxygenase (phytanoyl-CoA dioxygenase family)
LQGSLNVITVWIPFMDIGVDNFTLEVIPGSHLEGMKDGEVDGSVLKISCDENKFISLSLKKGDVLFMSGFLVHQTRREGRGFRLAVSQRFEDASDPTFIERGYPCAQKRVVERSIIWKPTVEQVKEVFL